MWCKTCSLKYAPWLWGFILLFFSSRSLLSLITCYVLLCHKQARNQQGMLMYMNNQTWINKSTRQEWSADMKATSPYLETIMIWQETFDFCQNFWQQRWKFIIETMELQVQRVITPRYISSEQGSPGLHAENIGSWFMILKYFFLRKRTSLSHWE